MKTKRIAAILCAVFILMFIVGCDMGNQIARMDNSGGAVLGVASSSSGDNNSGVYYVNGGTNFIPQGNPLFNIRNSSDPAIYVFHQPAINKDVLMMVTSSDLENVTIPDTITHNYYPMNATYLYTTSNYDGKWYDHGAILNERDISTDNKGWARPNVNNLWAPDIQYSISEKKFYLYVPAINDTDGTQRIGIATADEATYSVAGPSDMRHALCERFYPQADYFVINKKDKETPLPHNGYAYDPGVFYDDVTQTYYMSYCDYQYVNGKTDGIEGGGKDGRIHIAKMTDMKSATYIGEIKFHNDSGDKYIHPGDVYMEGPDISKFTVGGKTRYYLQFAAKADDGTEHIGYAMATPDTFNANPDTCWDFKGWVMENVIDQGDDYNYWTNHSNFCEFNGRPYIFYHKKGKDAEQFPNSQNRQVCAEELTLNTYSGEIMGIPIVGTRNGPFVQRLENDETRMCLTVTSSGDKPIVACQTKHDDWGSQQWTLESMPKTREQAYPPYVMKGDKRFKDNWTGNYLTVADTSNFAEVVGQPAIPPSDSKWYTQHWTVVNAADGSFRLKNYSTGYYLTCTGTYEGAGIRAQPDHPEWLSQYWRLNGNRFINSWSGKELTMTGKRYATVRAQPLDESWGSQKWVVETILGNDNTYRMNLRNAWSGKYLSEYNGNAVCLQEGGLASQAWGSSNVDSQGLSPDRSVWLKNISAGTYLGVSGDSGSIDYANVVCQPMNSSSAQIWHFK